MIHSHSTVFAPRWLALVVAVASTACKSPEPAPVAATVIVIGIDTLRADRLAPSKSRPSTAPLVDRKAREGMVFTRAYATSPWTLPSFASLFTGRLPSGHGVKVVLDHEKKLRPGGNPEIRGVFGKLHRSIPTLAEMLAAEGLATTAVVQNPILSPAFGLDRGFESYDYEPGDNVQSRRADAVVDAALDWIDHHRRNGEPFFLFVHFFDPHLNYDAPEPFRGTLTKGMASGLELPVRGRKSIQSEIDALSPVDRAFIEASYDEEVRFVDHELGRFFDALEARGLWDESLVVLTSDHGEEFFEHGGFEHGHDVFEELIRVPLIVWGPGVKAGRSETPVSIADIPPTILEAFDVVPPEEMFGSSLWPFLTKGTELADRPLLAEATLYGAERKALIQWPYKLIVTPEEGSERVFYLESDASETTDLSKARPEVARALRRWMERWSSADSQETPSDARLTPELIENLRALGYVR